jgi:crossover junction endodeoxyribonuclease RuvC
LINIDGNALRLIALGVLKLNKYEDHMVRLKLIFERIVSLIDQFHPDELSIEAPFYGKNIQSMLKLGRAQGVAISAALSRSLPIFEYSPRKIKQSITGKGAASKEQVAAMISRLLLINETPETLDATDALAVAVCHYFQKGAISGERKYSGWKSFIANNPDRADG